jgi:hypothetical protein
MAASMKGRPLRDGDLQQAPAVLQQLRASMKGRPLRGGDVSLADGMERTWAWVPQ